MYATSYVTLTYFSPDWKTISISTIIFISSINTEREKILSMYSFYLCIVIYKVCKIAYLIQGLQFTFTLFHHHSWPHLSHLSGLWTSKKVDNYLFSCVYLRRNMWEVICDVACIQKTCLSCWLGQVITIQTWLHITSYSLNSLSFL